MQPDDVAFIKAMISLVVLGGLGLAFLGLGLRNRRLRSPDLQREVEALGQDNAALRAELEGRLAEVEERLDFTERQLVQRPAPPRALERPARTPV